MTAQHAAMQSNANSLTIERHFKGASWN